MKNRFWVYIVASKTGTLYTGMTSNLDRRIAEHKQHTVPGFTSKYNCTRLLWSEEHSDVRAAITREKQIKGWLRSKKIALIESLNPHWEDLAEHWGAEISLRVGHHSGFDTDT
jgi:putative endonuclease